VDPSRHIGAAGTARREAPGESRITACRSTGSTRIPMTELTHLNSAGEAHMVDVGSKAKTQRTAVAEGRIDMLPETLALIAAAGHKKGDVLGTARIAGIMAAKKTADLIPLCHPLSLTRVDLRFRSEADHDAVHCESTVETLDRTGVEMEALSAVSVALLTIYDMCKAVDRGMSIRDVRLVHKSGGKSGTWNRKPSAG